MMIYLTFIKHLLIHLSNSANPNLSSKQSPSFLQNLEIRFLPTSQDDLRKFREVIPTVVILSTKHFALNEVFISKVT